MTSKVDPNRGPLQLSHDVTPKDLQNQVSNVGDLGQNPRFRGFPNGYFYEGRRPILGKPEEPPEVYHRRKQHFVKGLPVGEHACSDEHESSYRIFGDGDEHSVLSRPNARIVDGAIEYGSSQLPDGRVLPSPKKTLFWNEDRTSAEQRKKQKQVRDADWDISTFKETKQSELQMERDTKRRDLQMLKDYKPWGKAGGGAPRRENVHFRTRAMEAKELAKGEEILHFPAFGKPGHGAPLRTSSGNIITSYRTNTDIRFKTDAKDVSKTIENKTRYRTTRDKGVKFTNDLAVMAEERQTRRNQEKKQNLEEELKTWEYDPFGKPGAGAPLKTDSGNVKAGRQRKLVKDPYEMRELEIKIAERDRKRRESLVPAEENQPRKTEGYDPWGKGSGAPDRDVNGNVKRYKWSNPITVQEFRDPEVNWATLDTKPQGGGGQVLAETGEPKTKFQHTLVMDQSSGGHRGSNRRSEPIALQEPISNDDSAYDPWGKPGNGAPVLDNSGNIVAANRGKAHMDQMGIAPLGESEVKAKQEYLNTLKKGMQEQSEIKQREVNDIRQPGGEVTSWIRSKEIGYPKRDPATGVVLPIHYRGTSDVTQHQMDIRRPKFDDGYKSQLERQAEERHRQLVADKQASRDDSAKHHEKFGNLWNKPGAGAPFDTFGYRKQTLNMEGSAQKGHRDQPPWVQPHIIPEAEKKWVRTKAIEQRFKPTNELKIPGKGYEVRAPWAVM